ncbi:hypothetical protein CHLNCDRAFT_136713 [Chlorella variabilis]|uniref:Voltage-gated hydrogen channel 1 n=1 Tax=Chlorella variabilis TaxID=554065 RepID=E1ZKX0_CHLVA|nr:hypothetical protein CHLNCDRAFT_136713 [Chlorella variabilis]EFN53563.1 hypothetical protein CHLNCDRAFT_136713 [Chlorella variabilis]|eukprot:XP_005845665.1 hypothetical protein CHLNCDRAFT_136713 [Chlorella variabilis]
MPLACARSFLFRVLLLYTLCLQPEASLCLPSFRLGHPSTAEHTHSLPPLGPHLPCRRRRLATHHHSYSQATSNTDTDDAGFEDENGPPEGAASRDGGGGATTAAAASLAAPAELRGGVLSSGDDEGRWHDAMHRALMESLQPPRSEHPTWWGKRFHNLQCRMAEVLESREAHYAVIGLVLLDLAIVLTELVLSSFYPSPELAPHLVHVAEEALSYTSIGILAMFNAELLAKLLVFGFKYFTHSSWHMFDAVIVVISFTLELSLRGVAQEVASLLIFFRLWRIMRIMHGVAEAMELNHSQELSGLQARVVHLESELSVSQQRVEELGQQVGLLNVAAAAKGLDLQFILSTAASQQQQLAATAQQQLLAAAAATASKGMELQTILAAAAAQQQQVAAAAQQQLLAAAAAAAAAGAPPPAPHSPQDRAAAVTIASSTAAAAAAMPLLNGGTPLGQPAQQHQDGLPGSQRSGHSSDPAAADGTG